MDWAPVLIMLLLAMLLPTTTTVFGLRAAQPQCPHNNTVGPNYVLTYLRLDLLVGQALVLSCKDLVEVAVDARRHLISA